MPWSGLKPEMLDPESSAWWLCAVARVHFYVIVLEKLDVHTGNWYAKLWVIWYMFFIEAYLTVTCFGTDLKVCDCCPVWRDKLPNQRTLRVTTEFFEINFAFDFPAYLLVKIWASPMFIVSFHKISKPPPQKGLFYLTPTPLITYDTLQGSHMKQSIL